MSISKHSLSNCLTSFSTLFSDLSSTAIESLPSRGLDSLAELRIQNTHSLKQIPSVYNFKVSDSRLITKIKTQTKLFKFLCPMNAKFNDASSSSHPTMFLLSFENQFTLRQNLEKAWLTHSFHCCAFKFPDVHDPLRHDEQVKRIESLKSECEAKGGFKQSAEVTKSIVRADDEKLLRKVRSRRSWFRLIRSSGSNSSSINAVSASVQDFEEMSNDDGFLGGTFHEPATNFSNSNEATCGDISFK